MLTLTTLGRIDLRAADGTEVRALLAQPKRLAVFVYLAMLPEGAVCRRDTLLGLFWPELAQDRARAALRKALHFIRQAAGAEVFAARGADEVGIAPGRVSVDARRMLEAAAAGRPAEALALYGGELLPGFYLAGESGFERWLDGERDRLRACAAECVRAAVAAELGAGRPAAARAAAERGLAVSPDDEGALRLFMTVAARAGDRAGALDAFRAFTARLAAEYDLEPSAETRALAAALPPPDPAALALPEPASAAPPEDAAPPAAPPPRPAAPPVAPRRRRRWPLVAAGVVGAALAGLAARAGWTREEAPAAGRVVVLPFHVAGPADVAYLANGLPVLLAARLDGAGALRSVDAGAVLASAPEGPARDAARRDAEAAAARLGARLYVVGEVRTAAEARLRVSAALYDRARRAGPVSRTRVEGTEAELHRMADQLSTRLLARYLDEAPGGMAGTAARTTESPAALKLWLRGEDAFRRGRYAPAQALFAEAAREDPLFALAHYRLSAAASWAGDAAAMREGARRAAALEPRLDAHARTLLHATLALNAGRYDSAALLYRRAAHGRPADLEAWFGLAEARFHGSYVRSRPMAESRGAFEEVLRLDPGSFAASVHLARLAALRGDRAALHRHTAAALSGDPDGAHRAELLVLRAVGLGDAAARAAASTLRADPAALDGLWRAAAYTGAPGDAAGLARTLLRATADPEARASLHLLLAHLEVGRGCPAGAEPHLAALARHAPAAAALSRAAFALLPGRRAAPEAAAPLGVPAAPGDSARVYAGVRLVPGRDPLGPALAAALAARSGDEAGARRAAALLPDTAHPKGLPRMAAAFAALAAAGTPDERRRALRLLGGTDTSFPDPRPWLPRALLYLEGSKVLEAEGRREEALARLSGLPQDLGSDVAFLPAIHRRRAGLLRALGRPREAAAEEARARAMAPGCPAPAR